MRTRIVLGGLCLLLIGHLKPRAASSQTVATGHPEASVVSDIAEPTPVAAVRLLLKGTTEAQLEDYEEAIRYYRAALAHAPKTSSVLSALAEARKAQQKYTTALYYARKARRYAENKRPYTRRLADLQRLAGRSQRALKTYQTLLTPAASVNHYRAVAKLQKQLGRSEAALKTYRTLLNHLDTPPVSVYRAMLSLYRDAGNRPKVIEMLRRLADRRPNVPRYRRQLAREYSEQGRTKAAYDILNPMATRRPDDQSLQRKVQHLARELKRSER